MEVTALPVPTAAVLNVPVPERVTVSDPFTPESEPVIVAEVVRSYTLDVTAALEMVNAFVFTVLEVVATFTLVAPELERTMLPE